VIVLQSNNALRLLSKSRRNRCAGQQRQRHCGTALAPFVDSPFELIDRIVDTNLKGTIYCSQAVARQMIHGKRAGSIIHVSSVGAYTAQEKRQPLLRHQSGAGDDDSGNGD